MFVCVRERGSEVESPIISMVVCLVWSRAKRPFSCQNKDCGSELWVTAALRVGLLVRSVQPLMYTAIHSKKAPLRYFQIKENKQVKELILSYK